METAGVEAIQAPSVAVATVSAPGVLRAAVGVVGLLGAGVAEVEGVVEATGTETAREPDLLCLQIVSDNR